jgi:hypothetical protein
MINRLDRRNFLKAAGLAAAGATAGMAFANPVEAFAAATGKVRLMATGQALIENDLRQYAYAGYAAVAAYLKKADVRMCNLNVAIADPHADTKAAPHAGAPTRKDKFFHAADPQVLGCLKDMGFNLLALVLPAPAPGLTGTRRQCPLTLAPKTARWLWCQWRPASWPMTRWLRPMRRG